MKLTKEERNRVIRKWPHCQGAVADILNDVLDDVDKVLEARGDVGVCAEQLERERRARLEGKAEGVEEARKEIRRAQIAGESMANGALSRALLVMRGNYEKQAKETI